MSFNFTLENALFFKQVISAIQVIEEPIFRVEKDRVYIRQMDTSHVSLVHFELPKEVFDQYYCDKSDSLKFKVADMMSCLRRVKKGQYIGLSIDESAFRKLIITLSEKSIKDFTIPLFVLEEGEEKAPFPVTKKFNDTKIKMDASAFADSIAEFKSILSEFDTLNFTATEGHLILQGEGQRKGLTVTHMLGSDILAMEMVGDEVISHYAIAYLGTILGGTSTLSGVIQLEFSNGMPLKISYELPFKGSLYYFLSPKIDVKAD